MVLGQPAVKLIMFRDIDQVWYRVDVTGFNKVGYLTKRGTVIHPRLNRGLAETNLDRLTGCPHAFMNREVSSEAMADNIETYFTVNTPSIELFNLGIFAIISSETLTWFEHPIRLPILDKVSPGEYEQRWKAFRSLVTKADMLEIFDSHSLISRLIARFDHGTWSHVGRYSGEGTIIETISKGTVERDIEVYHWPRYRIGVYRRDDIDKGLAVQYMRSRLGHGYNWRMFTYLAVLKLFGLRPGRVYLPSPNDLARESGVRLIYVV